MTRTARVLRTCGWALGCAVLSFFLPAAVATFQSDMSADIVRRIDSTLRSDAANGFSGAVLVGSEGTVLLQAGYGTVGGVPVDPNTRFWIASTAKQFVGAAILKCQERGLLSLNDSLARFFPDAPPDKRHITIKQLLTHTSGLAQSYASEGQRDRETAVRLMLSGPADQTVGSFRYSNSNIQLAVAIVEVVSRRSYQAFARQELWVPAGLTGTGLAGDPGAGGVAAAVRATPKRLASGSWGGEGVYSTVNDLFLWYTSLRGGRILSQRSVDELFAPVAPISEGHAGLTWFSGLSPSGTRRIFIRGNEDFGPNSLIYVYPERDIVIVVLTHAGNADNERSWSRLVHEQIERLLSL